MKTFLCALVMLSPGFALAASALQFDTIRTLQGRTYRQCKILQRDAEGVSFKHLKGTARVLYSELPADTRHELGYSAKAAADLERSRAEDRQEKLEAARLRQKRAGELLHAARLEEIKRASQWNQAMAWSSYNQTGGYFLGPVPAVGFAAPGWNAYNGFGPPYGGFGGHHRPRIVKGWEGQGIGTIGAGSGGIYVPQSGGFVFTGLPQVRYSPTLGYYNPGRTPVRTLGTFNVVPGLMAPNPPAVVPGVTIRGSASVPLAR